jgi:2-hydroxy-3-keto-5-methylthiopentenyl-1-phosphate phosphatase
MRGQVALLDMSRTELDEHLADCRIDPAFPAFVDKAREFGAPLCVVSDGLDYAIHAILGRYGLDGLPQAANHLRPVAARRWQLTSPFRSGGCRSGTCKCASVIQERQAGSRTLLIGDGGSDFCAAEHVDFVFAKSQLIEHCRASGIPHVPIAGFENALELLPLLFDGRLVGAAPPPLAVVSL